MVMSYLTDVIWFFYRGRYQYLYSHLVSIWCCHLGLLPFGVVIYNVFWCFHCHFIILMKTWFTPLCVLLEYDFSGDTVWNILKQGCGSASGLDQDSMTLWIHIRNPDPGSRDPYSESGSGSREKKVKTAHFRTFFSIL
jgi:hypothetical protein